MKKFVFIVFILFYSHSFAQTADAGNDVVIYLTQGNTATLDGSKSNADTYRWTEVSTDYKSGATINNSTSKIATVSLPQGVFYFQLEATTKGVTKKDIMSVKVDHDPPPGTLIRNLEMDNPTIYNYINNRSNTSQLGGSPDGVSTSQGDYFFDRARSNSMFIDAFHSKFYSTIEDGYHWQSDPDYSRAEGSFGSYWTFDTSKTYVIEWKGYVPQDFSTLAANQTVGALFQVHSNNGDSPPFGFSFLNGHDGGDTHRGTAGVKALYFSDIFPEGNIGGYNYLISLDSLVNQTHTIRLIMREGQDNPILKVYVDGVEKYSRTKGLISNTPNQDYPKFATVYDYGNALVDPGNKTRGRKFSLVTEDFSIYEITKNSPQNVSVTISGTKKIFINN